ncbi:MAG TPA: glucosamine-6-phosphate deaminase [Clostridia bacterium]
MKALKDSALRIHIFDTRIEMGQAAADCCEKAINEMLKTKAEINMIFAAAPSQNEFLDALSAKAIDFSRINAFHMDEYAGLSSNAKQCFANYLKERIFGKVNFKSVNIINAEKDPEKACQDYAKLLVSHMPDIVCMGIGENGHIAFNDPPVADFNDKELVKLVELDPICRQQQVNDKCFDKIEDVPKFAVTLTVPALMSAKKIICVVPGATKAQAVKNTLFNEINEACPATILRTHKDADMFLDVLSAQYIIDKI